MNYRKTFFHSSKRIDLSPVERDFMTKNRFVKVFINNIKHKWARTRTISHELFHAIGFSGHSPNIKSCMFPSVYEGIPSPGSLVVSKLDQTMIEMLYRPEILPAMTFEEVRKVISTIKTLENTKKKSIWIFLTGKRRELE